MYLWFLSPCPPLIPSKHPAAELDDLVAPLLKSTWTWISPTPQPFSLFRSVSPSSWTGTAEPDYLREHAGLISCRPSIGCQTSKAWLNGCTISFGNSSLKMSRKHMCFHSGNPDRDLGLDLRHCQCEAQLGSSWLLLPTKTLVALDSFIVRPHHSALGLLPLGKCHLLCVPMRLGAQLLLCPI